MLYEWAAEWTPSEPRRNPKLLNCSVLNTALDQKNDWYLNALFIF